MVQPPHTCAMCVSEGGLTTGCSGQSAARPPLNRSLERLLLAEVPAQWMPRRQPRGVWFRPQAAVCERWLPAKSILPRDRRYSVGD